MSVKPRQTRLYFCFCQLILYGVLFARMAKDEMGCDGHQVSDQTIQRLAASHPHCQYRHSIHRGRLKRLNPL